MALPRAAIFMGRSMVAACCLAARPTPIGALPLQEADRPHPDIDLNRLFAIVRWHRLTPRASTGPTMQLGHASTLHRRPPGVTSLSVRNHNMLWLRVAVLPKCWCCRRQPSREDEQAEAPVTAWSNDRKSSGFDHPFLKQTTALQLIKTNGASSRRGEKETE